MENYCFVIQPFDDVYNKRYEDTFQPAVEKAGLLSYRVDKDPSVRNIIGEIEKKIREAQICFADISEDKPNVWYELGYATAIGKDVVMVCDRKREKLPFDINQRSVIFYDADAPRDFVQLETQIEEKINAYNTTRKKIDTLSETPISDSVGLQPYELAILAFLTAEMDGATKYMLNQRMVNAGFTDIATAIGLKSLTRKGYVSMHEMIDDGGEPYNLFNLTKDGEDYVLCNTHLFDIKQKK